MTGHKKITDRVHMKRRAGGFSLKDLRHIWQEAVTLEFEGHDKARMEAARATVQDALKSGRTVYGINTGFGLLASKRITSDKLTVLQENLVLSHSCGTGAALAPAVVRLILALKASSLAQGHSGVRPELVDALTALLEHDMCPLIPAKGSVGASGDLAPLAHLTAVLIGVGDVLADGDVISAKKALSLCGLEPFELVEKEGLALLNGTQVSLALALDGLFRIENCFAAAMVSGAISTDAMRGSDTPFDHRIHHVRRQQGQIDVAAALRGLLAGSDIRASHVGCDRVQDPYSIRCQPQVMGASLTVMRQAAETLLVEADAVTDNPLIFPEEGDILSGGNFHGEPIAMAADMLALPAAEIGSLSERRLSLLVDPDMSGLPAFLTADSGLNSGFMIAQVTSAALVSENKTLAHPACVDSIPTSAGQEDHVSMATYAGRRLGDMADNLAAIVAIELLAAAQGVDFQRPLRSSDSLEEAYALIRSRVPPLARDRYFAPDIECVKMLVAEGQFNLFVESLLPSTYMGSQRL